MSSFRLCVLFRSPVSCLFFLFLGKRELRLHLSADEEQNEEMYKYD